MKIKIKKENKIILAFLIIAIISLFLFFINPKNQLTIDAYNLRFEDYNDTHVIVKYNVINNNDVSGNCSSRIFFIGETIKETSYELGIIQPKESRNEYYMANIPPGKIQAKITVSCIW